MKMGFPRRLGIYEMRSDNARLEIDIVMFFVLTYFLSHVLIGD